MSVVTDFEKTGEWTRRLTIEVPAPAVSAETGRVIREINKSLRLPGFRQGKVPASIIRKRFPQELEQKIAERLVPRYWHQAEAEKSLDLLLPPRFGEIKYRDGEAMTFVAEVEVRPEIALGDVEHFDLPTGSVEPTEDEIDDAIADLRRQHGTWEPADRAAGTGDLVIGRMVAVDDSDDPPGDPFQIEIGAAGIDEELNLALVGLAAGQSTSYRHRPPDADQERDYRIEVTEVRAATVPELDDAFASRLGGVATVADLRQAVTARLRFTRHTELRQRRERALLDQLCERHPLDLPPRVVDQELEQIVREYAEDLRAQGIEFDPDKINWEEFTGQVRPQAQRRVRERLVLDAVAKARELKVDEQEFERLLASIARQQKKSSLAVRQELSQSGQLPDLRAQLLRRQTVRHLLGEDQDPGQPAPEAAAEGGPESPSESPEG